MELFQNTICYTSRQQQSRQDHGSHSVCFEDRESTGFVLDLFTGYT